MEIAAKPKEEVEEEDTEGVDLYKAGRKLKKDGGRFFFWAMAGEKKNSDFLWVMIDLDVGFIDVWQFRWWIYPLFMIAKLVKMSL